MTPAERVAKIEAEASGVWSQCGVKSKDREFLESVKRRQSLTPAQETWLKDIEGRVFGSDDE